MAKRQELEARKLKRQEAAETRRLLQGPDAPGPEGVKLRKTARVPLQEEPCILDQLLSEICRGNFKLRKQPSSVETALVAVK